MSIRALRRALAEMAELGHLTITKVKGMVNRYRIAAKFLRAMGHTVRPQAVPEPEAPVDDRQLAFDFAGTVSLGTVSLSSGGVAPLRTEGKAKESQEDLIKKEEANPFGRDAPLEEPHAGAVIKIAEIPGLKAKKKELRRQKVMRFITATYSGEECERRWAGMAGADPTRDEQWWFDKCDAEMILARWDDKADGCGWQRFA